MTHHYAFALRQLELFLKSSSFLIQGFIWKPLQHVPLRTRLQKEVLSLPPCTCADVCCCIDGDAVNNAKVTDWGAQHNSVASALAGLDQQMEYDAGSEVTRDGTYGWRILIKWWLILTKWWLIPNARRPCDYANGDSCWFNWSSHNDIIWHLLMKNTWKHLWVYGLVDR